MAELLLLVLEAKEVTGVALAAAAEVAEDIAGDVGAAEAAPLSSVNVAKAALDSSLKSSPPPESAKPSSVGPGVPLTAEAVDVAVLGIVVLLALGLGVALGVCVSLGVIRSARAAAVEVSAKSCSCSAACLWGSRTIAYTPMPIKAMTRIAPKIPAMVTKLRRGAETISISSSSSGISRSMSSNKGCFLGAIELSFTLELPG